MFFLLMESREVACVTDVCGRKGCFPNYDLLYTEVHLILLNFIYQT